MLKFLSLFLILTSFFLILTSVHAQPLPYGWQINQFDSNIEIKKDGHVTVTETLDVDFDSLQKHGIFRDIPYIYNNQDSTESYTKIEVLKVTRNDSAEKYTTSTSNGYLRIKIGDANKTVTGNQTYQIAYTATGILLPFEKYDELYWNVSGNYWDVPILKASAQVTLPGQSIVQTACYQGIYGSTTECIAQDMSLLGQHMKTFSPGFSVSKFGAHAHGIPTAADDG